MDKWEAILWIGVVASMASCTVAVEIARLVAQ